MEAQHVDRLDEKARQDGLFHAAVVYESIAAALTAGPKASVVGIDVPIRFGSGRGRPADEGARSLVGGRANSVFPTCPEAIYRV